MSPAPYPAPGPDDGADPRRPGDAARDGADPVGLGGQAFGQGQVADAMPPGPQLGVRVASGKFWSDITDQRWCAFGRRAERCRGGGTPL